jgi:hypothetical protein
MSPVRVFASCLALTLCAACGPSTAGRTPPAAGEEVAGGVASVVDPANISRVRTDLPPGYEPGDLAGRSAPVAFWGLGPQWTAEPAVCGVLAQPAGVDAPVRGWSASGPGGIVYAAVVEAAVDPPASGECGAWTVSAGHTAARVARVEAPDVDGASTVGMIADATTVVEGGTETHSRAQTFSAYLPGYVAFVTVVTDPGATGPALAPDFAPALLVRAVAALRDG